MNKKTKNILGVVVFGIIVAFTIYTIENKGVKKEEIVSRGESSIVQEYLNGFDELKDEAVKIANDNFVSKNDHEYCKPINFSVIQKAYGNSTASYLYEKVISYHVGYEEDYKDRYIFVKNLPFKLKNDMVKISLKEIRENNEETDLSWRKLWPATWLLKELAPDTFFIMARNGIFTPHLLKQTIQYENGDSLKNIGVAEMLHDSMFKVSYDPVKFLPYNRVKKICSRLSFSSAIDIAEEYNKDLKKEIIKTRIKEASIDELNYFCENNLITNKVFIDNVSKFPLSDLLNYYKNSDIPNETDESFCYLLIKK